MAQNKAQYQDKTVETTVTIASGSALSNEIDLGGTTLCGLILPSAWTTAGIGIKAASQAGGTFVPVYNDAGTFVSITAAASTCILLNAADFASVQHIKLWSQNGSSVDVNQAADRIITILTRPI